MDSLPTIPTPPAQRWREFKVQVLPIIVFLTVTAIIAFVWKSFFLPAGAAGQAQAITAEVRGGADAAAATLTSVAPSIDTKVAAAGE
jgi:hypothetical protein